MTNLTLNSIEDKCYLSHDIYEITKDQSNLPGSYQKGSTVRLISGVKGNKVPGYHPEPNYITVCRVSATSAEHIGILKTDLHFLNNDTNTSDI